MRLAARTTPSFPRSRLTQISPTASLPSLPRTRSLIALLKFFRAEKLRARAVERLAIPRRRLEDHDIRRAAQDVGSVSQLVAGVSPAEIARSGACGVPIVQAQQCRASAAPTRRGGLRRCRPPRGAVSRRRPSSTPGRWRGRPTPQPRPWRADCRRFRWSEWRGGRCRARGPVRPRAAAREPRPVGIDLIGHDEAQRRRARERVGENRERCRRRRR